MFDRLIQRFGSSVAGIVGESVSNAGLAFLGGAPRDPNLKPGAGREYSTIREAEQSYSYTVVSVEEMYCPRCGHYTREKHTLELHHPEEGITKLGGVKVCRRCDSEHWMFVSHMPRAVALRQLRARSVP